MSEKSIAAGTKNLIPLTTRSPEVHRLIAKHGGQQKTERKAQANKWRGMKERYKRQGMKDDDIAWMIERIENRDSAALDILMYIREIQNDIHPAQRIALANTLIAAGKFAHGDKIKMEAVNVNVNTSLEEIERRLLD